MEAGATQPAPWTWRRRMLASRLIERTGRYLVRTAILAAGLASGFYPSGGVLGQTTVIEQPRLSLFGKNVQGVANGVVNLMGFLTVPDSTANAISFNEAGDTNFTMGQTGVGFTLSDSVPLYLEGFLGWSRYDPRFTFSQGAEQSVVPTKWSTVAGTVGVGWDVPIAPNLVLRPILNGSLGHMETDISIAARVLSRRYDEQLPELRFLDRGRLNTFGLGGSLMLDYMIARKAYEIDVELRYTHLLQQSFDSSPGVRGSSEPVTLGLWSRLRWPSALEFAGRPVRWVLEGSYSYFLGTQQGALGFDWLGKVGGGIEFDLGRQEIGVFGFNAQRLRVLGRYVFGNGVSGMSLGLAVSF